MELTPYEGGSIRRWRRAPAPPPPFQDARDEARLTAFRMQNLSEVTNYAMDCMQDVDEHRCDLAGVNPPLNMLLAELETACMNKLKRMQRGLYNGLGA